METFEKVRDAIAKQLNISKDKITREAELVKDLGADSLDLVELLMGLEEEYGVTISEDDTAGIKNVGDIIKVLEK